MGMVSEMISDLKSYKRWLGGLTWKKVWFGVVVSAAGLLIVGLVILPLRAISILDGAAVRTPPNIEKIMGEEFNFPMVKSAIEFLSDIPEKGFTYLGPKVFGRPWGTLEVRRDSKVLIPYSYSDTPLNLEIRYERGIDQALGGGIWRGNSAFVRVQGVLEGVFPGNPGRPNAKWGRLGSISKKTATVTPYFRVAVPFNEVRPDQEIGKRTISLEAVLNLTFPGWGADLGTWKDYTGDRTGDLECLILSPSETRTYQEARRAYFRTVTLTTLSSHGGILLALSLLPAVALWRCREDFVKGWKHSSAV